MKHEPTRDDRGPLLSICIATHHGRRDMLQAAIDSVLTQLTEDRRHLVEICVSDNASSDGTEEMMASYVREHGDALTYVRNPVDVGRGRNVWASIQLARGAFCWPLGSDDAVAADAVDHVFALIDAYPNASGFSVGLAHFDARLIAEIGPMPRGVLPAAGHETKVYETPERIIEECAILFISSASIFNRARALAAVGPREGEIVDRFAFYPAAYVYVQMVKRDPQWVWYPRKLVKERLVLDTGRRTGHWFRMLFSYVRSVSHDLRDTPISRRSWETRLAALYADPFFLQEYKSAKDSTLGDDWDLLYGSLRTFGPCRATLRAVPTLLVPHTAVKAARRAAARKSARRGFGAAAEVDASIPEVVPTRCTVRTKCRITNVGGGLLSSTVRAKRLRYFLGYQWHREGDEVVARGRVPLTRAIRRGRTHLVDLDVATPWEPGAYELRVSIEREDGSWPESASPWAAAVLASSEPLPLPPANERPVAVNG